MTLPSLYIVENEQRKSCTCSWVQLLTGRRPIRSFSPGQFATTALWKSARMYCGTCMLDWKANLLRLHCPLAVDQAGAVDYEISAAVAALFLACRHKTTQLTQCLSSPTLSKALQVERSDCYAVWTSSSSSSDLLYTNRTLYQTIQQSCLSLLGIYRAV